MAFVSIITSVKGCPETCNIENIALPQYKNTKSTNNETDHWTISCKPHPFRKSIYESLKSSLKISDFQLIAFVLGWGLSKWHEPISLLLELK